MSRTLSKVKNQNKGIGHHFFDYLTMEFFSSKIHCSKLHGDKFFVTSEKTCYEDYTRVFSVRLADQEGRVETVVKDLETLGDAMARIKELLNADSIKVF